MAAQAAGVYGSPWVLGRVGAKAQGRDSEEPGLGLLSGMLFATLAHD